MLILVHTYAGLKIRPLIAFLDGTGPFSLNAVRLRRSDFEEYIPFSTLALNNNFLVLCTNFFLFLRETV